MNFTGAVNNNIILLACDKDRQVERLKERGYDNHRIELKKEVQFDTAIKRTIIMNNIQASGHGQLFEITNGKNDTDKLSSWLRAQINQRDALLI